MNVAVERTVSVDPKPTYILLETSLSTVHESP